MVTPRRHTSSKRSELLQRFWAKMDNRYQAQRTTRHAKVTGITRDNSQRVIGVEATIDGVAGQKVTVDFGMPAAVGDTFLVENRGSPTMPQWAFLRRVGSIQGQPWTDPTPTLPTPTSLSLDTGHQEPFPGGGVLAWIYAEWLHAGDSFGPMRYEVQYRESEENPPADPTSCFTIYSLPQTQLDGSITIDQTIIKRDVNAGDDDDFPRFGRLRIEDERIDYTKVRYEDEDSGTGTGSSGQLYDSGKSWDTDEWEGYCLTDSGSNLFVIESNTEDTLYVTGTPASGAYTIKPCFSGCTRGAGGSDAATHADDTGVGALSWGCMIQGLVPDRYYDVRVRCHRESGAVSAWTAWASISTSIDTTAPPEPTGLATTPAVMAVQLTWTGPTPDLVPDLAGFEVYMALDSSGTSATLVATLSVQYQHYVPQNPGLLRYFNLKAFDYAGNTSDYGEETWVEGHSLIGSGEQLLTNADWERDLNENDEPDRWAYSELVGDMNKLYGAYGLEGGAGLQFSPTDEAKAVIHWPNTFNIKIRVQEGETYTTSVYFKTTEDISNFDYGFGTPDGKFGVAVVPCFHDGVSTMVAAYAPAEGTELYALGDNWYRIYLTHEIVANDISAGKVYIGCWIVLYNRLGYAITIAVDRPQLERGQISEWKPGIIPPGGASSYGLLIDNDGIKTTDGSFWLTNEGKLNSDLVIDRADGTDPLIQCQIDSTTLWVFGYDESDDKIKIHKGTSLPDAGHFEFEVTATTAARLTINCPTSGDPQCTFEIAGSAKWAIGVDDSADDQFVFSRSSTLTTTNTGIAFYAVLDGYTRLRINSMTSEASADAFLSFAKNWIDLWVMGFDDSDSQKLKLNKSTSVADASHFEFEPGKLTVYYASGDPTISFEMEAGTNWTIGIDDSDQDRFKIHSGLALVDDADFEVYTGGIVFAKADFRAADGLSAGDTSLNPAAGDVLFTGQLVSYKNSTQYEVFGYAPISSPSTAGPLNTSQSVTVTTYGVPTGAKAVAVMLKYQESGGSTGLATVGKASGAPAAVAVTASTSTGYDGGVVEVSSDAVYFTLSGGTLNAAYITFLGYWI